MLDVVALITARGGSKGIPGKNIIPLAGKPLIAWTIEAARASKKLSRVIVSTDDANIADVARQYHAEVPFRRPAHLAEADTPHIDVVLHALDWLEETTGTLPDYLLLLQPTAPLRTTGDIDAAITLASKTNTDGIVSVCPARDHPFLVKKIGANGCLVNYIDTELAYLRRQDLPPAYVLNGALYLTKSSVLRQQKTFQPEQTQPYVMPVERSFDIDEWMDLQLVRFIMEEKPWGEPASESPTVTLEPIVPVSSLRKPA